MSQIIKIELAITATSATRLRQQWFSECIFPLRQLTGLTSACACSFFYSFGYAQSLQPLVAICNRHLLAKDL